MAFVAACSGGSRGAASTDAARSEPGDAPVLVLYDGTGPYPGAGETSAAIAATLGGHFGDVTIKPVAEYAAGDMSRNELIVYIGTTYDEPLPSAFLADAAGSAGGRLIWAGLNVWQLVAAVPDFGVRFGFLPGSFDERSFTAVRYRGVDLPRAEVGNQLIGLSVGDPQRTTIDAVAVASDSTTTPWAVTSGRLTYIAENPLSNVSEGDRYLAFADLLAPAETPVRRRALVRIEDVNPTSDPNRIREFADYLSGRGVPFSIGVIPEHRDPLGPDPTPITLADRPLVVEALRDAVAKGATLVMHGYTHQLGESANPTNGTTAIDYEFMAMTTDAAGNPSVVGPVPGDSAAWALERLDAGLANFAAAGLERPTIFEFPHYVASSTDYAASVERFTTRYERITYFPGALGGAEDFTGPNAAILPYVGTDIWGATIVPENLGYVITDSRPPAVLLETATRLTAVRDAVASFFYHPYLGIEGLQAIVEGLHATGWEFVAPATLIT